MNCCKKSGALKKRGTPDILQQTPDILQQTPELLQQANRETPNKYRAFERFKNP